MQDTTANRPNPYVGPRAFRYGEHIYGRDHELTELLNVLIAERIVLLYSPSGAGKTSLIQAGLIPKLEEEKFEVLPTIRLGLTSPQVSVQGNRYLLSTLSSLETNVSAMAQLKPEQLSQIRFSDYLERRERDMKEKDATVLIFDQFEEILTLDPLDQEAKHQFFEEVGVALRNSGRWALFSMREDYIAAVAPYVRSIPTRLKSTFRLDLLTVNCATQAIKGPALQQHVEFKDEAAIKLVDDLRAVAIQTPSGAIEQRLGPYVEPVQLQVVCYRMWNNLPADVQEIRIDHIGNIADVDTALAEYYAGSVQQIASETGVRERLIRDWFDRKMITESGMRSQILLSAENIKGLTREAIRRLQNVHLVRGEERRGATWLELSHDRLLKPIRTDNTAWFERNLHPLQKHAAEWQREGRPDSLCLSRSSLREATHFAHEQPDNITDVEREFLQACHNQIRAKHWRKISLVQALTLSLMSFLATLAFTQCRKTSALELAARAVSQLDSQLDVALIQAFEAEKMAPRAPATRASLFAAVEHNPRLKKFLHEHKRPVSAASFSPDGRILATGDFGGQLILRDSMTGNPHRQISLSPNGSPIDTEAAIRSIAFSPDGKWLAVCTSRRSILMINRKTQEVTPLQGAVANDATDSIYNVWSLSFSSDSALLISGDDEGYIVVWDVAQRRPIFEAELFMTNVRAVAIYGRGEMLAAGGANGTVAIWHRCGDSWSGLDTYFIPSDDKPSDDTLVTCLAFGRNGRVLAVGSHKPAGIHLFDLQEKKKLASQENAERRITGLAFDDSGERFATASYDGAVRLWRALPDQAPHLEQLDQPFTGHVGWVECVAISSQTDGGRVHLASGGIDRKVILWETTDREFSSSPPPKDSTYCFSSDGAYEAGLLAPDKFMVRHRPSNRYIELPEGSSQVVKDATFSRDGHCLATVSDANEVTVHQLSENKAIVKFKRRIDGKSASIALNADGSRIAMTSEEKKLWFFDTTTGKELPSPKPYPGSGKPIDFSPDGRWLAGGGPGYNVVLWNPTTHEQHTLPELHNSYISDLEFSPDSKMLVSGSGDNTLIFWDVAERKPIAPPLTAHRGVINRLAFSPDQKLLATAGWDRTVQVWDIGTKLQFGPPLVKHLDEVRALSFSADGKRLFSGSHPGDTAEWDLDPESWRKRCRERANRNLSRHEWKTFVRSWFFRKTWSDLPVFEGPVSTAETSRR